MSLPRTPGNQITFRSPKRLLQHLFAVRFVESGISVVIDEAALGNDRCSPAVDFDSASLADQVRRDRHRAGLIPDELRDRGIGLETLLLAPPVEV